MNKKTLLTIAGIGMLLVLAVVAYVLRPSPEASAPIEAQPVIQDTPASSQVGDPPPTSEAGNFSYQPTEAAGNDTPTGAAVYAIDQNQSVVRFSVDEILRGNPTTAVGETDQVAGEIALDLSDPGATQLGMVTINARTIETDQSSRNRMIQNEILDTAPYEFITFTPTSLIGLPNSIEIGQTYVIQIIGDLTIRDITQSVTFEAHITIDSASQISGYASTIVLRSNFDLVIPDVPSVAGVEDEVLLEIEFVAVAQ